MSSGGDDAEAEGGSGVLSVRRCRLTVSKPVLKPPSFQRLKLQCDETFSIFAFNIHVRRYISAILAAVWEGWVVCSIPSRSADAAALLRAMREGLLYGMAAHY
jgi:hypothetical protein